MLGLMLARCYWTIRFAVQARKLFLVFVAGYEPALFIYFFSRRLLIHGHGTSRCS